MAIKAVFFDVGETLINEARLWNGWAAYLGVPAAVFISALEKTIGDGQHHRHVFDRFRLGFDLETARRDRAARNDTDLFTADDLYPDALPCLRALRARGYMIGIAGNQPAEAERMLSALGVTIEVVTSSASLGVEKPSPAFFKKLIAAAGSAAAEVLCRRSSRQRRAAGAGGGNGLGVPAARTVGTCACQTRRRTVGGLVDHEFSGAAGCARWLEDWGTLNSAAGGW
jgi:phosphoglycolate phosphatase-like HAD superfamily hydrolase